MSIIAWFRAAPALVCFLAAAVMTGHAAPVIWPGIHRVVILGDSITHSGEYVADIEAYLVTRFPERHIEILNLGLPSETVSGLSEDGHAGGQFPRPDLHERLARVLKQTKPDLVVACYGMNDGIYLPFAEERFVKYREGIQWLRDRVAESGARILLVTPPTFDEVKGGHAGYGEALDKYAAWLVSKRAKGWDVVDTHTPMNKYLAERRAREPGFFLAGDGVHTGPTGHWLIAREILAHLDARDAAGAETPEAMLAAYPDGGKILSLIGQKQRLLRDAWLTQTHHLRPGMATGLPVAEAEAKAAELEKQIRELAPHATATK